MNKKILIVDDNIDLLNIFKLILLDKGYEVLTSSKGEYAENLIKRKKELPDLIILDIVLGDKDGRAICWKLKKSKITKHIPIIMVSSDAACKKSSMDANANFFIAKPFENGFLLKTIQDQLA